MSTACGSSTATAASAHSLGGGPLGEDSGSYVDTDDPLAARFARPTGVCSVIEGNILICDHSNHRIRTILRNGSVRTLAGSGTTGYADSADPLQAMFYYPHGIASTIENGRRLIIIGGLASLAAPVRPQPHLAPGVIGGAARAITAPGAAAAALAGFAAAATMGHATRMGALMRSVETNFWIYLGSSTHL